MNALQCESARLGGNWAGAGEGGIFVKKTSKKRAPSNSFRPWASEYARSGLVQWLQVLADVSKNDASVTGDAWLASVSRIVDGLASYALCRPKDAAEIQRVESDIATVLLKYGTPRNKTRTMRMRRGKKLGSPRAVWAAGLLEFLALEAKPTRNSVAISIANALFYDWPGETGPLVIVPIKELVAQVAAALPDSLEPEGSIIAAMKAVGFDANEARQLFDFANKRAKRGAK